MYGVLRLVKRRIVEVRGRVDTMICTYFFKTLMFWSSEEQPQEFLKNENVRDSLVFLLNRMVDWIAQRNCPNCFISANNMMDHIPDCAELHLEQMIILGCIEAAKDMVAEYNTLISDNSTSGNVHVKLQRNVINRIKLFTWWLHDMTGCNNRSVDGSGLTETDKCMVF